MKEINIKMTSVKVKSKITKNRFPEIPYFVDDWEVVNMTGKSDEELHNHLMNDPTYRDTYDEFVKNEIIKDRENKIKRITK